jgi:hypothetical protein
MKHENTFKAGDRVRERAQWRGSDNHVRDGRACTRSFRGSIGVQWDSGEIEDVPAAWLIRLDPVTALARLS